MMAASSASRPVRNVPVAILTVSNGVITHVRAGSSVYGGLPPRAAKLTTPPDAKCIKRNDPRTERSPSTSSKALDTLQARRTASKVYAIDLNCLGNLWARPSRTARFSGGQLRIYTIVKSPGIPGVKKVVR